MDQPWLEGELAEAIARLKAVFSDLSADFQAAGVDPVTIQQLNEIANHLDELFLLVVVGEFNSGKSAMINALFGRKICPEGVTPTTDKINVLAYGDQNVERYRGDYVVERLQPFEELRNLQIVDTPGTNSIIKAHQDLTEGFIPKADLILFVTSIDRPYSASEQQFLRLISERWRKKIIFVLTKIDTKEPQDIEEVTAFIKENCRKDFGFTPLVLPCSPKQAYQAKNTGDDVLLERSQFQAVEDYIFQTLTEKEKLSLKLLSPVDTVLRVCDDVTESFNNQLTIIADHEGLLTRVGESVEERTRALKDAYNKHLLSITNLLGRVENKAVNFLDDQIQLRNFRALMNRSHFKTEFENKVIHSFQEELWGMLSQATDEVVRAEMDLWSKTFHEYNDWVTMTQYKHEAIGRVSTEFEYNRDQIIASVRHDWERTLNTFNHQEQVNRILDEAGKSLHKTLGVVMVSAAGGVVGAMAVSGALPVVGVVLGAVFLAAMGTLFIPGARHRAKNQFRERFSDLRTNLVKALQDNIDEEVEKLITRIEEKLATPRAHFQDLRQKSEMLLAAVDEKTHVLEKEARRVKVLIERGFDPAQTSPPNLETLGENDLAEDDADGIEADAASNNSEVRDDGVASTPESPDREDGAPTE